MSPAHRANRICCDGHCCQGRDCPLTANLRRPAAQQRLAPGVIDGPHRRPGRLLRALRAAWLHFTAPERP